MQRIHSRQVVLPAPRPGAPFGLEVVEAWLDVEGSVIANVHRDEPEASDAVEHVDYGDMLVSPAFIDAHTHVVLSMMRGRDVDAAGAGNMVEELFFRVEEQFGEAQIRPLAKVAAYESLLSGVGLVWDHYYEGVAVAESLAEAGLCAVVAPTLQDLSGPGRNDHVAQLAATRTIHERQDLAARGVFAALGPHATDTVSGDLWGCVNEASKAMNLPVHVHVAQSVEEYERAHSRHGVSPLAWLDQLGVLDLEAGALLVHLLYASAADLDLLSPDRHHPVFCPYSALVFGFPAPAMEWEKRGLPWIVATDCAANNDTMNVQKELRFIAGQRTVGTSWSPAFERFFCEGSAASAQAVWDHRGVTHRAGQGAAEVEALLARVWSIPGSAHPHMKAGSIETGALANLVVWDTEHPVFWPGVDALRILAMADPVPAIHTMYTAGRQLGEPGDFHRSLAYGSEFREARQEADLCLASLKL
jgi:5-methylthioadenosine/S-adenosylhomocysteine deaminase